MLFTAPVIVLTLIIFQQRLITCRNNVAAQSCGTLSFGF